MKFRQILILALILLLWGFGGSASAILLGFSPSSQSVSPGQIFTVDVAIQGLFAENEIVSAFDLDVRYNPGLLVATEVSFGTFLDDLVFPGFTFQDADITQAGLIDFAEESLLSDDELALQQLDSFVLATLTFQALTSGTDTLFFDPTNIPGIDIKGRNAQPLSLDLGQANITIEETLQPIPEPGSLYLLAIGIATVLFFRGLRVTRR